MFGKRIGTLLGAAAIAITAVACSSTDPGLTTAVKSKLAADDTVKAYRIDVDTKDAVVTLNGAVDTAAAAPARSNWPVARKACATSSTS